MAIHAVSVLGQYAIDQRGPAVGLIHHSERGVQYAAAEFRAVLDEHGFVASMSSTGTRYDNAATESFCHTLKTNSSVTSATSRVARAAR